MWVHRERVRRRYRESQARTGAVLVVATDVFDFDVSRDGRWLVASRYPSTDDSLMLHPLTSTSIGPATLIGTYATWVDRCATFDPVAEVGALSPVVLHHEPWGLRRTWIAAGGAIRTQPLVLPVRGLAGVCLSIDARGTRVAYLGTDGKTHVAERTGETFREIQRLDLSGPLAMSPDGSWIAVLEGGRLLRVESSGKQTKLGGGYDRLLGISPDGAWIAVSSRRSAGLIAKLGSYVRRKPPESKTSVVAVVDIRQGTTITLGVVPHAPDTAGDRHEAVFQPRSIANLLDGEGFAALEMR